MGKKSKTPKATNEPWAAQQPYLKDVFGRAQGLSYQPLEYGPDRFIRQGDTITQGIQQANQFNPQANLGAARDYTNDALSGKYLDGNPYLQDQIDRSAQSFSANVSSLYGGAGRIGSGAAARAFSQGLGNLEKDIRYRDYANERGLQSQAVGQAIGVDNAYAQRALQGQDALFRAGGIEDSYRQAAVDDAANRFQFEQMEPWDRLQRYNQLISGNYGGTQTGPEQTSNRTAGALGGALSGAATGSYFGPWGAAIGGGIGLIGGLG